MQEQRLYHIVAALPKGDAHRLLADVRTAATDCLSAGGEVDSVGAPGFGQESVRITTRPSTPLEPFIDYIYFRRGEIVVQVAYAFVQLTDPTFTEEYARLSDQRLRTLCDQDKVGTHC